jgi:DNA processing protein
VAGRLDRWDELTEGPVVAVLGSGRASDYGVEVARSLGRGLAAAGVTVAAMLADGVCAAALGGCVEVGGGCLCAHPGGVDVGCAGRRRGLCERVRRHGCAIAELPCGTTPRRWGAPASERVAVGLAAVTVLVEAREQKRELAPARLAEALGRPVGAIPGRLTSPLSAGTNTLLAEGAHLIRGAADVLELLHTSEPGPTRPPSPPRSAAAGLAPRLRSVLDRVGSGEDTADRVTASSADPADVLLALTELEVLGLLARGDGGRYVVRGPLPAD